MLACPHKADNSSYQTDQTQNQRKHETPAEDDTENSGYKGTDGKAVFFVFQLIDDHGTRRYLLLPGILIVKIGSAVPVIL